MVTLRKVTPPSPLPTAAPSGELARTFGLDLLRATAIGLVVIVHVGEVFYAHRFEWFNRVAPDGVGLFFVLSGFLISLSLLRHLDSGGTYFRFWLKRAVRTVPPYFLALALYGFLIALLSSEKAPPSPWAFIFMQNFAWPKMGGFPEGWSLSVEEWYYALFLLLAALLPLTRERKLLVAACALLAVATSYKVSIALQPNTSIDHYMGTVLHTVMGRIDSPAIGVVAAYLSFRFPQYWSSRRVARTCLVLGLLGAWGTSTIATALIDFQNWELRSPLFLYIAPTVQAISWALLLVPAIHLRHPGGAFELATRQVARSAFSIYLTHYSIVAALLVPLVTTRRLIAFAILTAIISQTFYLFIERPTVRMRNMFGPR